MKKVIYVMVFMLLLLTIPVQARIVPEEEVQEISERYSNEDVYTGRFFCAGDIQKEESTGMIRFREKMNFIGEEPAIPDIVYIIDEKTDVVDSQENLDAFAEGKLPWLWVYLSNEDIDKIKNEGLREVHVAHVFMISSNVVFYPSPEEMERNERLAAREIMVGDEDGGFYPYRTLTRAELTKIAVMLSAPNFREYMTEQDPGFTDVSAKHWAYSYIAYAKQAGIIDGYEDGSFQPEMGISCAEAVKIFTNILGYTMAAEETGGYPEGYMRAAERNGLLQGLTIKAEDAITRRETAIMACNALDIPLMVQTDENTAVLYDGSLPEYPLSTLEIKNFS